MAVKKYKVQRPDKVFRVYWDGRAIIIEDLDEDCKWRIMANIRKGSCFFEVKTFSYYGKTRGYASCNGYATATKAIEYAQTIYLIKIPEEVKEYLLAYDTMDKLASV